MAPNQVLRKTFDTIRKNIKNLQFKKKVKIRVFIWTLRAVKIFQLIPFFYKLWFCIGLKFITLFFNHKLHLLPWFQLNFFNFEKLSYKVQNMRFSWDFENTLLCSGFDRMQGLMQKFIYCKYFFMCLNLEKAEVFTKTSPKNTMQR